MIKLKDIAVEKQIEPYKILIYGEPGVGKTTLASLFDNPLFIDTENSTSRLKVARLLPKSRSQLNDCLMQVYQEEHDFKTLVIDTLSGVEEIFKNAICMEYEAEGIDDQKKLRYGRGYTLLAEYFERLFVQLDNIRKAKGINIVMLGHSKVVKIEKPDQLPYDQYQPKLTGKASDYVISNVENIFFINHVANKDQNNKAVSMRRLLYTKSTGAMIAKNRLPALASTYDLTEVDLLKSGGAKMKAFIKDYNSLWLQ